MSRSARITFLLIIDVLFFFVELVVGYAVGSLALVADSFHMLNDVMSLIVALYAIKLTASASADSRYSYGWHRAEILAALVNGVFLLALCFTISLEAVQRFFTEPDISNPKLVVVVGSLGLASNILGLFLFHEHSHAHPHDHHKHTPSSSMSTTPTDSTPINQSPLASGTTTPKQRPLAQPKTIIKPSHRDRSPSVDSDFSLYGHPVATRASLVQAAHEIALARSPSPVPVLTGQHRHPVSSPDVPLTSPRGPPPLASSQGEQANTEATPLLSQYEDTSSATPPGPAVAITTLESHSHRPHSHGGSMNMRALVLHVMGDALGNVGVIATGLVIWLSDWKYKYYFDPAISLVITIIIFSSALPLVRSASFILLQGVPPTISLDALRISILSVKGVLSLHELHVWQLSESKIIASVHVLASRDCDFMPIAVKIREIFHVNGIHSCTIQPEYECPPPTGSEQPPSQDGETNCLILCPRDDQACDPTENACCPPPSIDV